jgi:Protein of unknown function (DUF1439)
VKKILIVFILLAIAAGGAFFYFKGKRYDVVIAQDMIDASLAKRFPMTKKYLLIFSITYSNPQVTLLENEDRVQVGLDATVNIRIDGETKNLSGTALVTSGIRYDSETQEFFLDDAEFSKLQIDGTPEKWTTPISHFASKAAKEYIEKRPIYHIKVKDSKTKAAKMLLKGFEIKNKAIYVTLGY